MGDEQTAADGDTTGSAEQAPGSALEPQGQLLCDRCGFQMFEINCKIVCPNCGSRFDCSDLSIYSD